MINDISELEEPIDWVEISVYQKLSESFIEKYSDKVNWYCVSVYQKLSESFIDFIGIPSYTPTYKKNGILVRLGM